MSGADGGDARPPYAKALDQTGRASIQAILGGERDLTRDVADYMMQLQVHLDNDISGGKVLGVGTRKVNCRAATALRVAAQSLHHSKTALGDFYRRLRARLGPPKAITAAAHKLARIIFHLVTTGQEFDESRFAAQQLRYQKRQEAKNWELKRRRSVSTSPREQTGGVP